MLEVKNQGDNSREVRIVIGEKNLPLKSFRTYSGVSLIIDAIHLLDGLKTQVKAAIRENGYDAAMEENMTCIFNLIRDNLLIAFELFRDKEETEETEETGNIA